MELKYYVTIIKSRIWLLLAFVVISCTTTWLVTHYLIKPVYQASVDLFINSAVSGNQSGINLDSLRTNIQLIETYKEIAKSNAVMEEVAMQHPELGLTAKMIKDYIDVSSVPDTPVITISTKNSSYHEAVNIVQAVAAVIPLKVQQLLGVNNMTILNKSSADELPLPLEPRPKRNVLISFALSLLLGIGFIILLDYMDDTIKSEQSIATNLGIPVMGTVPTLKRKLGKKQRLPLESQGEKVKAGESPYAIINQ